MVKELESEQNEKKAIEHRLSVLKHVIDAVEALGPDASEQAKIDCVKTAIMRFNRKDCLYICKVLGISVESVSYNQVFVAEEFAVSILAKLISPDGQRRLAI